MGAESHSYNIIRPPCANCGKREAVMGSSDWRPIGMDVCSRACGTRLDHKIRSGMVPKPETFEEQEARQRVESLRLEIRCLRNLLNREWT